MKTTVEIFCYSVIDLIQTQWCQSSERFDHTDNFYNYFLHILYKYNISTCKIVTPKEKYKCF